MALSQKHTDILTARGLDVERLTGKGWHTKRSAGIDLLVMPVVKGGIVVNHKRRMLEASDDAYPNGDRHFRQDKNAVKCFYNFDCLTDPTLRNEPLIITEGEFDCESALEAGFARTVSVPDGAPDTPTDSRKKFSYLLQDGPDDSPPVLIPELMLDNVKEVIVAVDNDRAGGFLYDLLVRYLGPVRCRQVRYPWKTRERIKRHKDLNEVLQAFGVKGVQQTIANAQPHPISGIFALSDLPPKDVRMGIDSGFPGLGSYYRLRKGDFAAVIGIPGHGKTTFLLTMAYLMAVRPDSDLGRPWNIVMALFETEIVTEARQHLIVLKCGKPMRECTPAEIRDAEAWINAHFRFIIPDLDKDCTLDWLMERTEAAVMRFEADMVIWDPWNEIDHSRDFRQSETDYTKDAIRRIKRCAKKFDVHWIVSVHPSKEIIMGSKRDNPPRPSMYDAAGSAHWFNKPDVGLSVHRDPKTGLTTIDVQKTRYVDLIGMRGKQEYRFNRQSRRYEVLGDSGTEADAKRAEKSQAEQFSLDVDRADGERDPLDGA